MKITDIISFKNFYDEVKNEKIPFSVAYKLNKIYKIVSDDIAWYQAEFNKLIEKYAKVDNEGNYVISETGDSIVIKEEFLEQCNNEVQELNNMEFVCDIILTMDDISNFSDIKLAYLEALMNFIIE